MRAKLHEKVDNGRLTARAWPAALNEALHDTLAAVSHAHASLASAWRWPPPECTSSAAQLWSSASDGGTGAETEIEHSPAGAIQPGWWTQGTVEVLRQQLQAAAVPELPAGDDEAGESWTVCRECWVITCGLQLWQSVCHRLMKDCQCWLHQLLTLSALLAVSLCICSLPDVSMPTWIQGSKLLWCTGQAALALHVLPMHFPGCKFCSRRYLDA